MIPLPRFPLSTTLFLYLSPSFWQLRPGLISSCTYSSPVLHPSTRIPTLSCRASYHPKWSCKVYDARGSLPSSSYFLCFFFCFCFVLLHGVWWAWDGSLLFFFSLSLLPLLHISRVSGATITSYLLYLTPLIYLDCTLFSLSHLLGAMGCMAPWVGIIGGIGVWAEGFASTDSQSYIYLIGTSWSLVSFLLFSLSYSKQVW